MTKFKRTDIDGKRIYINGQPYHIMSAMNVQLGLTEITVKRENDTKDEHGQRHHVPTNFLQGGYRHNSQNGTVYSLVNL